jgi:hypothetical protein
LPTAIELQEHSDYEVMLIGSAYSESMGQSAESIQKEKI